MATQDNLQFEEFLYLCNLFGSCQKRTQGAGGNISVKWENTLLVKASGYRLSAVSEEDGYVYCNVEKVTKCYENNEENLEHAVMNTTHLKPSMETFFHLLPKRYIVHIHSTFFCKYLCKSDAVSIFTEKHFPQSLFIPYRKPGLQLAKEIIPQYKGQSLIFLENHGIILLGDSIESLLSTYNKALTQLESICKDCCKDSCIFTEKRIKDRTNLTVKPVYTLPSQLPTSFCPITPDHFLFLGQAPLKIEEQNLESALLQWNRENPRFPSVLQVDSQVYILGNSFHQCQNKEEYLQSYFEISADARPLSDSETQELLSCSKETFRLHTV